MPVGSFAIYLDDNRCRVYLLSRTQLSHKINDNNVHGSDFRACVIQ